MAERYISETLNRADAEFELTLRPGRFADFEMCIRDRHKYLHFPKMMKICLKLLLL